MLLNKVKYSAGDVIGLKLVNGDEIIAKFVEFKDGQYLIDRPCCIVGGAKGIGLIQAMFSLDPDKSIALSETHVMMTCEAVPQMRDHYFQVTTGIQPVSKGSIIV